MIIRKAKQEDAEEISKLIINTILEVNSKDYTKTQLDALIKHNGHEDIARKINDSEVFCLEEDGKIVGTVALQGQEVRRLYVDSKFLRKGFGKKLMLALEKSAKDKGIDRLFLRSTLTATDFFIKIGYTVLKKVSWDMGGVVLDFVNMGKIL